MWRIHAEERDLEPTTPEPPPEPPSEGVALPPFQTGYEGYLQAMEWVFIEGIFLQEGPATAWMRMRIPLLAGEAPSPLTRVLAAVDSASGISSAVDFSSWLFVNPDLSVYLNRLPRGEWICLDAATTVDKRGIGLAAGRIFDTEGEIGRSLQSLFIAPATARQGAGAARQGAAPAGQGAGPQWRTLGVSQSDRGTVLNHSRSITLALAGCLLAGALAPRSGTTSRGTSDPR